MTAELSGRNVRRGFPWRIIGWGGVVGLLLLPLVTGAPWTLSDYVIMGIMLGGAGIVLELAARSSSDLAFRAGTGLAVATAFLLIWVNGAVGFLGSEDNPANLIFAGVILTAVVGVVSAGFRAAGMAKAMFVTAVAQILAGMIGLAAGWASPGAQGLYEVVMGTSVFACGWLVAGGLFRRSAERQEKPLAADQ